MNQATCPSISFQFACPLCPGDRWLKVHRVVNVLPNEEGGTPIGWMNDWTETREHAEQFHNLQVPDGWVAP